MSQKTISLAELLTILKKKWLVIIGIIILVTLMTFAITKYLITPKYEASSSVYIGDENAAIKVNQDIKDLKKEVEIYQLLMGTYAEFAKSGTVAEDVVLSLKLSYSAEQLMKMVTVTPSSGTQVMSFAVISENPDEAAKIANQMVISLKKISKEIRATDNVFVLDTATTPIGPVSPNMISNLIRGSFLGFAISLIVVYRKNLGNLIKSITIRI